MNAINNNEASNQQKPLTVAPTKSPVFISPPTKVANAVVRFIQIDSPHSIYDYQSWSDFTLKIIAGTCELNNNKTVHRLSCGQSITIPAGQQHTLSAVSDFRAIIFFE